MVAAEHLVDQWITTKQQQPFEVAVAQTETSLWGQRSGKKRERLALRKAADVIRLGQGH